VASPRFVLRDVIFRGLVIRPLPVLDDNLTYAATGGHNVATYVAVILLYLANGSAGVDNAAR
jgi:hypothetical protein